MQETCKESVRATEVSTYLLRVKVKKKLKSSSLEDVGDREERCMCGYIQGLQGSTSFGGAWGWRTAAQVVTYMHHTTYKVNAGWEVVSLK